MDIAIAIAWDLCRFACEMFAHLLDDPSENYHVHSLRVTVGLPFGLSVCVCVPSAAYECIFDFLFAYARRIYGMHSTHSQSGRDTNTDEC